MFRKGQEDFRWQPTAEVWLQTAQKWQERNGGHLDWKEVTATVQVPRFPGMESNLLWGSDAATERNS